MNLIHNAVESGEWLEVYGIDPDGEEYLLKNIGNLGNFLGVVSAMPLKRIKFNEDPGGDDICLSDINFAVKEP